MTRRIVANLLAGMLCLHCAAQQKSTGETAAQSSVEKARAELRAAEAAHPGNTIEVANALDALIREEIDDTGPDGETLAQAQRLMTVAQAAAGEDSAVFVSALADIAEVYLYTSQPATARPYAERAMEIAQKQFPGSDPVIGAGITLLDVCDVLADFPCAERAAEAAMAAARKPGKDHEWSLAAILCDLSDVKERMGDQEGAGAAIKEALAVGIRVRPDDPQIAVIEANVGVYDLRNQQFAEALPHLNRSIELSNRNFGPGNPFVPRVEIDLGELYSRTGQFPLAWKNFEDALANAHTTADELAREHGAFSRSLALGGDLNRAIAEGLLAERMGRETFLLQARTLPERQALTYEQHRPHGLYSTLSVVARHPELASPSIYQEVARSRALVADEMARREKNLNAANDPEVARLLAELKTAQSVLLQAEAAPPASPGSKDAVSTAQNHVDAIERALAERSAAIRNDARERAVELADLRKSLPPHSVLISYVAYKGEAIEAVDPRAVDTPSYIAFAIHPGTDRIDAVGLGAAKPIDDLVAAMRASVDAEMHGGGLGSKRNERLYRQRGNELRRRIWDPLSAELQGATQVIVVPDGTLNLIPFAALPAGNGYLVEHGPAIHMLSSERDLIPAEPGPGKSGLLVLGSPQFELASVKESPSLLRDAGPPCEAIAKMSFPPLPGSGLEAAAIDREWRLWNAREPATMLTGAEATRRRFVEESSRNRILHLATHAFVVDSDCGDGNPLLHSGLVFAGADHDRGTAILTAQQIASLDLSGVDLAVLSACNTGNGELRDGEGVLGLQRAFRIAGAHTVVMTLWPVDDTITSRYMRMLYGQLLKEHASAPDAAWQAGRQMLTERRAAGQSTHPWYWAAFVASGAQ